MSYAISSRENFEEYWKGKSENELILQINLAAKDLRNFRSISKEQQKRLMEFCLNLNKEVMFHHNQYYPTRLSLAVHSGLF